MPVSQINGASIESGAIPPADLSTGAPAWDGSGNLSFNSGYGSSAVAYGCRAWVNFNGTGTPAILASGNVSSITDYGVGDYGVNLANAMPDTNYCIVCLSFQSTGNDASNVAKNTSRTDTTSLVNITSVQNASRFDWSALQIAIFR
jgi:hypothetical protein